MRRDSCSDGGDWARWQVQDIFNLLLVLALRFRTVRACEWTHRKRAARDAPCSEEAIPLAAYRLFARGREDFEVSVAADC